jgi:tetratricopeptide (TPR) repeat protein
LRIVLLHSKQDTGRVNALNRLAWQLMYQETDTSVILGKEALALAEKLKWKKGIAISCSQLGTFSELTGDLANALQYDQRNLDLRIELKERKNLIGAYANLAGAYDDLGNAPKAVQYYLTALSMAEQDNDSGSIALVHGNLGLLYERQLDHTNAFLNYNAAVRILDKENNPSGLANNLGNLGIAYADTKNDSMALICYHRAIRIFDSIGNYKGVARNYSNIANALARQTKYRDALGYDFQAMQIDRRIGNKKGVAIRLGNIGDVYYLMGKKDSAEYYLLRSLDTSIALHLILGKKEVESSLSDLYENTGRYELALQYYKAYIADGDSLNNADHIKEQTRSEMQYVFDKKTSADSIHRIEQEAQEKLKHDSEIRQQQLYTYGGIGGFALMLIVAIVSIRAFRNKKKANEIIAEQKMAVEVKQKEIIDSINYAKRIQNTLLPKERYIMNALNKLKDK